MKQFVKNLSIYKYILSCIFLLLFSKLFAQQNLVENPSFDYVTSCSFFLYEIKMAYPWDTLKNGRVSYYRGILLNKCNQYSNIPLTPWGVKFPRSGAGFAELSNYVSSTINTRLYIQAPLKQTLISGHSYAFTVYVSRLAASQYAIDRFGAYLDDGSVSAPCAACLVNVTPQVENPRHNIISDTVAWTKIQGCFIATGIESYLTLGNFAPDSLVDTLSVPYNPLYGLVDNSSFFIDDVSVVESGSSVQAGPDTLINKGDTALLGAWLEGMPVEWYNIDGSLLANSSQVLVSPSQTTSYIVKMDLCGFMSQDTLTVFVNPLGISNIAAQQEELQISPNPATNLLMIQSANMLIKEVKIWDVLGRLQLGNEQIRKLDNEKHIEIEISSLSKGIYFVKAMDKQGRIKTGKFVKE